MSNQNPIINRSRVREIALTLAKEKGKILYSGEPRFLQVSAAFLDRVESSVYAVISREVDNNLSGRTLR